MTALELARINQADQVETAAEEALRCKEREVNPDKYVAIIYDLYWPNMDSDWEKDFREAYAKL